MPHNRDSGGGGFGCSSGLSVGSAIRTTKLIKTSSNGLSNQPRYGTKVRQPDGKILIA